MRESTWNAASEAANGSRGQVENKTRAHALGGMDIKLKKPEYQTTQWAARGLNDAPGCSTAWCSATK